jgi:hypothetical protein
MYKFVWYVHVYEIQNWFKEEGLNIIHEHQDFYGITIRGKK